MSILWELYRRPGPVTFTELKRLTGISPVTLSRRLKALEAEGMVSRRPLPVVPRRVEYSATPMVRELGPVLRGLLTWRSRFPRPAHTGESKTRGRGSRRRPVPSQGDSARR